MSEWAEPAIIACDCGGETRIVNTRGRVDRRTVHRQRQCRDCGVTFSTFESRQNPADALRVEHALERMEGAIQTLAGLKEAIEMDLD